MSRFLDERGRFFGKVNVVDLVVLLVIIAIVVFAVVRMTGGSSTTVPVKVTYTVQAVQGATVDALDVKGTVRDDGGTVLGEVAKVTVRPTLEEYMTRRGAHRRRVARIQRCGCSGAGSGLSIRFHRAHRQCPHAGGQKDHARGSGVRSTDGGHGRGLG